MIDTVEDMNQVIDYIYERNERGTERCSLWPESREEIQEKLMKMKPLEDHVILKCTQEDRMSGVFILLVCEEDKYIELLGGFSKTYDADREFFQYMKKQYEGYAFDLNLNPDNRNMIWLVQELGGEFEEEQVEMKLENCKHCRSIHKIVTMEKKHQDGYCNIHEDEERYWTADKVIQATDRFHVFLALDGDEVIGYVDVTHNRKVNHIFDLFVKPEYRNQGYGRALMQYALDTNTPKGMSLEVDVSNVAAHHLYLALGFTDQESKVLAQLQL